ncbi:hypothetical protein [Amycolatopsis sp. NPDC059657]|uniref:hypothetical protein n=1 Tax=Amycolatopsis sp. NPDC059657 TaxID=3346899 RepID=UPI00366DAD57
MIHTRLQLDPGAQISLRSGRDGAVEIVVLDPASEALCVIEMSPKQLAALCEEASVQ